MGEEIQVLENNGTCTL